MSAAELIEILQSLPDCEVVILKWGEKFPATHGRTCDNPINFTAIEAVNLRGKIISLSPKDLIV